MKIKNFTIIIFLSFCSCNFREINYTNEELNQLKSQVLLEHNYSSFNDLYLYYENNVDVNECDILPYLIPFLNKKNNDAYFYSTFVVCYIKSKFKNNFNVSYLDSLDYDEKVFLVSLINNGVKLDDFSSVNLIAEMYDKGIYYKKNEFKADSLRIAHNHKVREK
ncbi:MAG: hypothetical protein EAZ53_13730 [Bacteroidetes bacterium]|nr:MAG: hypothetical protein EAZ53_13730 [Bacteroidota bacterium]